MLTLNISVPFAFTFLLVCFPSEINQSTFSVDSNPSLEYGNIETFLCNDSFYPYTSIGTRYSYIPSQYILDGTNCAQFEPLSEPNLKINTTVDKPIIFFINKTGVVRGPKSGTISNSTELLTLSEIQDLINQMDGRWINRTISPGLLLNMIPNLLSKGTQCVDEELVYSINQSIYNIHEPDSRNPNDPTRKTGVFPKCSGPSCYNNEFRGKRTKQPIALHDQMFRTKLLLDMAKRVLKEAKLKCNEKPFFVEFEVSPL